ncbi:MAG: hypothetical protein ITF98_05060 [Fermentimonas sp.]|nr:hypothetical protein [Fermentimonas sp.]
MKTKNFLLTGALLIVALFSVNGVMAADPIATQSTANVTIRLHEILSIVVQEPTVLLEYKTASDYNNGSVNKTMSEHLLVNSTGPFTVTVKTLTDFKKDEDNSISKDEVKITATRTDNSPGSLSTVVLNETATNLITSTKGGFDLKYDVNYNHKFKDGEAFTKRAGDYKADVTYEITAS